jgi:hypothetical protein
MGGSDAKPTKRGPVVEVGPGQDCPSRLTTIVSGPTAGITKGSWLEVRVDRSGGVATRRETEALVRVLERAGIG